MHVARNCPRFREKRHAQTRDYSAAAESHSARRAVVSVYTLWLCAKKPDEKTAACPFSSKPSAVKLIEFRSLMSKRAAFRVAMPVELRRLA